MIVRESESERERERAALNGSRHREKPQAGLSGAEMDPHLKSLDPSDRRRTAT